MRPVFHMISMAVFMLMIAGCVSEQISPDYKPKMGVAQSSDGSVTFALQTRPEYEYAIYYQDPKTNEWKVIPGCERIRGTGEMVEVKKQFNSRATLPAFTVRHTLIK